MRVGASVKVHGENGLFATTALARGDVAVCMKTPVTMYDREFMKFWGRTGVSMNGAPPGVCLEQHFVVRKTTGGRNDAKSDAHLIWITDEQLTKESLKQFRPHWYFINHEEEPNMVMKRVGGTMSWVAQKDINAGDELTFAYNPDCSF